jgi:hypothetical protein
MKLSKKVCKAMLDHAIDDETRPHLHGIAVGTSSAMLAATDGHRLALYWAEGEDVATQATIGSWLADVSRGGDDRDFVTVPRALWEQAIALCGSKASKRGEDAIAVTWDAAARTVTIAVERADGLPVAPLVADCGPTSSRFPAIWNVVPKHWKPARPNDRHDEREAVSKLWAVNADYLAQAAKLCAATCETKSNGVRVIPPTTAMDPMVVEGHRTAVVIMPMGF